MALSVDDLTIAVGESVPAVAASFELAELGERQHGDRFAHRVRRRRGS
jgi:hypothetical protein